jgi:hypothetical protein
MKKSIRLGVVVLLLLAFLGETLVVAQETTKAASETTGKVETAGGPKGILVVAQEATKPASETTGKAVTAGGIKTAKAAAKPETINGTVLMVDTDKKLLVLTGSGGVLYDFKLTNATRIKIGGQKAKLDDLSSQANKQASVAFVPLRTGNMARSVEVSP